MEKALLVFQTDFTYKEGAVPAMLGVVMSVDRDLRVFNATHEIPQYDIWSASYRLVQYLPYWPAGTVFMSVVDPGVGTPRRPCAALTTGGHIVISPDNGTLTHLAGWVGIRELREIDTSRHRLPGSSGSHVFHGRDIFSYTAARLASGQIRWEEIGPAYRLEQAVLLPLVQPVTSNGHAEGIFEIGDPNFGNLWSNISLAQFEQAGFAYGQQVRVQVRHHGEVKMDETLLFERSFGYAKTGEALVYTNELLRVAVAVNQGSLMQTRGLGYGPHWQVSFSKPDSI